MTDVVDSVQEEIVGRLNELAPLVAEFERLTAAAAALADLGAGAPRSIESGGRTPHDASSNRVTRGGGGRSAGAKIRRRKAVAATPDASPEASEVRAPRRRRKRKRTPSGAAQRGIIAALEHGSHSVRELVTVTAMSDANIRGILSRLVKEGVVSKTKRGDGKRAYALRSQALAA